MNYSKPFHRLCCSFTAADEFQINISSCTATEDLLSLKIKLRNCRRKDTGPVTTYRKIPLTLSNMDICIFYYLFWRSLYTVVFFSCMLIFRYFQEIFNVSGYNELVKKYGSWFTSDQNPRAQIFRRNHTLVTDLDSMVRLMRYSVNTNFHTFYWLTL